jgi:hypothetical protein
MRDTDSGYQDSATYDSVEHDLGEISSALARLDVLCREGIVTACEADEETAA